MISKGGAGCLCEQYFESGSEHTVLYERKTWAFQELYDQSKTQPGRKGHPH